MAGTDMGVRNEFRIDRGRRVCCVDGDCCRVEALLCRSSGSSAGVVLTKLVAT